MTTSLHWSYTNGAVVNVDALLCDFAQVNGGKLYVTGAGINLLATTPAPPHPIGLWLGIVVTIPWTATNQMHRLRVSLIDADNNKVPFAVSPPAGVVIPEEDQGALLAQFNVGRAPIMQAGEDTLMPVAFPIQAFLPILTSYSVVIEIDGSEVSRLRFRAVSDPFQGAGSGPAGVGPADLPRF